MNLEKSLYSQTVAALRMLAPIKLRPHHLVRLAVARMRQRRVGCTVVVDDQDRPIGQFSERTLIRLLDAGRPFLDDPVERHLSEPFICLRANDPLASAIRAMEKHGARFLLVVDEEDQLIGLTGQKALMLYLAESFPRSVKVQALEPRLSMDHREGA